jgi:hypothetical protein
MSKPILQLQNGANWKPLWTTYIAAEAVPDKPGYTLEIPTITIPILLENHIIAISAKSPSARPSWKVGGRIAKKISTGITLGGTPDVTISDGRKLWLNQINLFRFTPYTPTYSLEITPVYYLTEIYLALWIYIGVDTETTSEQLNRIEFAVQEISR